MSKEAVSIADTIGAVILAVAIPLTVAVGAIFAAFIDFP